MPRRILGIALVAAACGGAQPDPATPTPQQMQPLAGVVGENLIVAPVQALRLPADLGWPALAARQTLARLDSVLTDTLRARVGNLKWVFADGLLKAAANNPTYATDPRALAVNSLRAPALKVSDRLFEPLATQLRTMIAFQDARLVLIPVDLTIDRTGPGIGRSTVRLVLIDPRSSVVRWIGQVQAPDSPAFTSEISATLASRLADLFVAK